MMPYHPLTTRRSLWLPVEGESMRPFLIPGDRVLLNRTPYQTLREDDVILIRKHRTHLLHRIIYKTNGYVVTKGDNKLVTDGRTSKQYILGRVAAIKRKGETLYLNSLTIARYNTYMREVTAIARSFRKHQITYAYLKGLPLYTVYHIRRHSYSDIDVLVEGRDLRTAVQILTSLGYRMGGNPASRFLTRRKENKSEYQFIAMRGNIPVIIDLHTDLSFAMTNIETDGLYSQRRIEDMTREFLDARVLKRTGSSSIAVLEESSLLLYLSLHFFHHNFRGVKHLFLMRHLMKDPQRVNYVALAHLAKRYRVRPFVYPVFRMLINLYRVPVPASFLQRIRPHGYRLRYIERVVLNSSPHNDVTRLENSIQRFTSLFILSEEPFMKKLLALVNITIFLNIVNAMAYRTGLRKIKK